MAVTDLVRNDAGRVVGVTVRDDAAATWTERAEIVVGADGRGSVVAERVAAPVIATGRHAGQYAYGYWPAAARRLPLVLRPGVSGGVIPTNDGLACVFVGGPPGAFADGDPARRRRIAAWPVGSVARSPISSPALRRVGCGASRG